MESVYIIAEIGPNHNGNLNIALDMIDKLAKIGVDAIKFQLVNPDEMYSKDSFKASYQVSSDAKESAIQMSKNNQLHADDHLLLYERCKSYGVDYLCTGFDMKSIKFLNENFDLKYFKIASGEIFSIDIIDYISKIDKPVILSTGMSNYDEVAQSIDLINQNFKKDITILHCISNYPAPFNVVNLRNMTELSERFNYPVGFSDHTLGNECAIASVALGGVMIEKHVTFDKQAVGPDHKASSTIDEFAYLVKQIRNIESALGGRERVISEKELETKNVARKSIVSAKDLEVGNILKAEDFCYKRPGTGFLPNQKEELIGKKVIQRIEKDRVITSSHIE
ncbi:N-acetylneuraminate synthase family protein [Psychroserpens sp. AS72]|uniref:N-acetylneuraminate synthase family protein n=1 Tax=Psychroserpens sp. AS72 TaxID=3135775 RepID=UPI00317F9FE2